MTQCLHKFCRSLCRLIRSWYCVDRIRVIPSNERLLKIPRGARLLICGRLFAVASRDMHSGESPIRVVYQLSSEYGPATLSVMLTEVQTGWQANAELCREGSVEQLLDGDVIVLKSARGRNQSRSDTAP